MFVNYILYFLHCFYNPFVLTIAHTKAPQIQTSKKSKILTLQKWAKKGSSLEDVSVLHSLLKTKL